MNLFFLLFSSFLLTTTAVKPTTMPSPKVFVIEDNPKVFESLSEEYPTLLYIAAGEDLENTLNLWTDLQLAMETYAKSVKFNVDGLKCYSKVYFSTTGEVEHIGYSLMPDSKPFKAIDLYGFFTGFMKQYTFPVTCLTPYSHYGGIVLGSEK